MIAWEAAHLKRWVRQMLGEWPQEFDLEVLAERQFVAKVAAPDGAGHPRVCITRDLLNLLFSCSSIALMGIGGVWTLEQCRQKVAHLFREWEANGDTWIECAGSLVECNAAESLGFYALKVLILHELAHALNLHLSIRAVDTLKMYGAERLDLVVVPATDQQQEASADRTAIDLAMGIARAKAAHFPNAPVYTVYGVEVFLHSIWMVERRLGVISDSHPLAEQRLASARMQLQVVHGVRDSGSLAQLQGVLSHLVDSFL